ncbi:MAG: hypothetical protein IPL49_15420 [Saprospirales bacterium]|nr:hypothetical protein [Saprospirales bacterium]
MDQAGWPEEVKLDYDLGSIQLLNYKREVVTGDIVHYSFEVQIGTNQYDKIGIHRVVKESTPGQPLKTEKNYFFQHGDAKNFVGMMLPAVYSPSMPNDHGLAIFLAQNNIDVWGIDQPWCFPPAEASGADFDYFENYDLGQTVRYLRTAMAIVRIARYLTGNELTGLNMSGYSSGVSETVAALDLETQLDPDVRHARTFIPVDLTIKSDRPEVHQTWNNDLVIRVEELNNGNWAAFVGFTLVAELAKTDPGGDSPIIDGFTNFEVAQFFSSGPIFGDEFSFHYWAADYVDGFPAGDLKYLTREQSFDFMASAIEWQPNKFYYDQCILHGESADSPYDDHFSQIKVPVLCVAAGGGFGQTSKYGIDQLGSTDVTHLIPSLEDPENVLEDFGHIDLFTALNAKDLWWGQLVDWLEAH